MNHRRWVVVAVIVPLMGLLVMIGSAEVGRRSGEVWQVPIAGYDPRDLLHGQYLRYQFRFAWQGANTCGSGTTPALDCCLCLTRSPTEGQNPGVRQIACDEARRCDDWLRSGPLRPPLRYFVPEDAAKPLEDALREREASVEIQRGIGGRPAIGALYLDGRPWREVLAEAPVTQVP